jgi:membrane dipeptidase
VVDFLSNKNNRSSNLPHLVNKNKIIPVIDFHCDLLGCVEHNCDLDFESPETNCSVPQLNAGNILIQTLAIGTITRQGSSQVAQRQVALYNDLLKKYPKTIDSIKNFSLNSKKTHCIFAIENASGLIEEDEHIDRAFECLEQFISKEKIAYVSLTWNDENRFGGGNVSSKGLKPDGELLLKYLSQKNIAIDFSHTSDALAEDILNFIDNKSLQIPLIASHSNYREIMDAPRNLPKEIAKEIINRNGVIGLNFIRRFVGEKPTDFLRHIDYALSIGAEDSIVIGADYYGIGDMEFPTTSLPPRNGPTFQKDLDNSSCMPNFISLLESHYSTEIIEKITSKNALDYLQNQLKAFSLKS